MKCRLCSEPLLWVHGHGQCDTHGCPLKGQNQAPCCEGETSCSVTKGGTADGEEDSTVAKPAAV